MFTRLIKSLFPGVDSYFIGALSEHAYITYQASVQFQKFILSHKDHPKSSDELSLFTQEIFDAEKKADEIARTFTQRVQQSHSWQLPFDADQMLDLMNRQDDIIDALKSISEKMTLYSTKCAFNEDFLSVSVLISKATLCIYTCCQNISAMHKNADKIRVECETVDHLESEADKIRHDGLRKLFMEQASDDTVRYTEKCYEMIEGVMDKCEDVAKLVSTILVKNI